MSSSSTNDQLSVDHKSSTTNINIDLRPTGTLAYLHRYSYKAVELELYPTEQYSDVNASAMIRAISEINNVPDTHFLFPAKLLPELGSLFEMWADDFGEDHTNEERQALLEWAYRVWREANLSNAGS